MAGLSTTFRAALSPIIEDRNEIPLQETVNNYKSKMIAADSAKVFAPIFDPLKQKLDSLNSNTNDILEMAKGTSDEYAKVNSVDVRFGPKSDMQEVYKKVANLVSATAGQNYSQAENSDKFFLYRAKKVDDLLIKFCTCPDVANDRTYKSIVNHYEMNVSTFLKKNVLAERFRWCYQARSVFKSQKCFALKYRL